MEDPRPGARPLGLRPDAVLIPRQLGMMRRLTQYDLSPVRSHIYAERCLHPAIIDAAILEFRRYLSLHYGRSEQLTMFSEVVDVVWHTCLLFTRLYNDLCMHTVGLFMHHDPWRETKPRDDLLCLWQQFA